MSRVIDIIGSTRNWSPYRLRRAKRGFTPPLGGLLAGRLAAASGRGLCLSRVIDTPIDTPRHAMLTRPANRGYVPVFFGRVVQK